MNALKIRLLFAFLLFSISLSAQSPRTDGKLSDWMDQPFKFDPETGLNYAIRNDSANLYLAVQALDERIQRRLIRIGFRIAIDPKGKKKDKVQLTYKPEMVPAPGGRPESTEKEQFIKKFMSAPLQLQLNGFQNIENGTYYAIELPEVVITFDYDSTKALNMEVQIPFSKLPKYKLGSDLGITLMLLPFERPEGGPQGGIGSGRGGRGGPGGMGGMGGGQGVPPGGRPNGPNRQGNFAEMAKMKTVWLVYKPKI